MQWQACFNGYGFLYNLHIIKNYLDKKFEIICYVGPLKGKKKGRGKSSHINNFLIRANCILMYLNKPNLPKEEIIAKYSSPTKNLEPISLLEQQITIENSPKPEYLITLLSHW